MSDSAEPILYQLRLAATQTTSNHFAPASPRQIARLRFLGVSYQEPLFLGEADALIERTDRDPKYAAKIRRWQILKHKLHPDLYPPAGAVGGENGPPAPALPSVSVHVGALAGATGAFLAKYVRLALAGIAALALLGSAAWVFFGLPEHTQTAPGATDATSTVPAAQSPQAVQDAARDDFAAPPADLAKRIADAQRLAILKYPELGIKNTEINSRFTFRYERLLAEHSARLADGDWPLQLADQCARASGLPLRPTPRLPQPVIVASADRGISAVPAASKVPPPARDLSAAARTGSPLGAAAPLIALNVVPMNAGTSYQVNWLTDYGSFDVTGRANKALDLEARNLSAHPSPIVVQWIFTGRKPHQGGRFIFDMGARSWELQANQKTHFGVRSADLTSRSIWYASIGRGSYQGAEMDGWIVLVRYRNQIIKALGSSAALESLVGTSEFSNLVTNYDQASSRRGQGAAGRVADR